ncbi:MAG TPA: bifunctional riboflavin kinase/FAD synthetase [Rhabdaerophilum sp.]|nr:bifunctional riboflavin kinase/FAD synthetase [Rhabdaerophilum sp.]
MPAVFSEWRVPVALAGGYPPKPEGKIRIVAIGNFDGAHLGHRAVATAARALGSDLASGRCGTEILALTFEPHPRQFFQPDTPHFRLVSESRRGDALRRIGFDGAVILPFDDALAGLAPETFISEILMERLHADGVVVGEDFHFGKGRAGTPTLLKAEGERRGIAVRFVQPYRDGDGAIVASSAVRKALGEGRVADANRMLGYAYSVSGPIIHGEKRGRELGYRTANMKLDPATGLAHGIYAVRVRLDDGRVVPGVASFGRRPHFDNGAPLLETHLFDFEGDLYGREIEVIFESYLRGETKFDSLDALIAQMDADSLEAKKRLTTSTKERAGGPRAET